MSKIKDFFKHIYKDYYNSDTPYLIARITYISICTIITATIHPNQPLSLDAIFGVAASWLGVSVALLPIFFILYGLIAFIVDKIELRSRR